MESNDHLLVRFGVLGEILMERGKQIDCGYDEKQ